MHPAPYRKKVIMHLINYFKIDTLISHTNKLTIKSYNTNENLKNQMLLHLFDYNVSINHYGQ
jgi:hypothetical protein